MSRASERQVVSLCLSTFSILPSNIFSAWAILGTSRAMGIMEQERRESSWDKAERGRGERLCGRDLRDGYALGSVTVCHYWGLQEPCCHFSAIGCLSLHWTVMGLNCHSVQQLPHSDESYIVAIELKREGERGNSGEIVLVFQHPAPLCPAILIPAWLWGLGTTIFWLQDFIIYSSILWKALCKLLGLIQRWVRPVVHLRGGGCPSLLVIRDPSNNSTH